MNTVKTAPLFAAGNPVDQDERHCQRCTLSSTVVLSTPCPVGGLLAVGEAPGALEEQRGEGFVGDAGKKLDAFLLEQGVTRAQYGRANICRCRPENNRKPKAGEIRACLPFLAELIVRCKPKVILAVGGGTATQVFCGKGTLHQKLAQRPYWLAGDCKAQAMEELRAALDHVEFVVPMPHTSPLAMNRYAPDGTRWETIARQQIAQAVALLGQEARTK